MLAIKTMIIAAAMLKPRVHFLVCQNQRPPGHPKGSCTERGGHEVLNVLMQKAQTRAAGGDFDVKVTATGCLGPCMDGATMVVYPDAHWYGKLDAAKAAQVFDSHVDDGKAVEALLIPDDPA